jgi:hypothetical protein
MGSVLRWFWGLVLRCRQAQEYHFCCVFIRVTVLRTFLRGYEHFSGEGHENFFEGLREQMLRLLCFGAQHCNISLSFSIYLSIYSILTSFTILLQ